MTDRKATINETLLRVLNKYLENQRQPRRYGLEEPLYPAEIHALVAIGIYPHAGVTELAARAGVTKGAMSQMIQKLEQKELIRKRTDPENNTRVILELTNKGKIAYYSHEQQHEEVDRGLYAYLDGLRPGQLKVVQEFLSLVETGIDKRRET